MTPRHSDRRQPLAWPRSADDGTPLGIDIAAKAEDVRRIVLAKFGHSATSRGIDPDDLVQTVLLAILRRNRMPCAYDPRRSSFGHYVFRVTRSQFVNLTEVEARHHDGMPMETDDGRQRDVIDDRMNAEERYAAAEQANPAPQPLWRISLDAREAAGPQLDLFGATAMVPPTMAPANDEAPPPSSARPRVRHITARRRPSPTLFTAVQ